MSHSGRRWAGIPSIVGGAVIGGIYDDRFLFNTIQMSVSALGEEVRGPSYEGAKPMLKVCDVDDVVFLKGLLERYCRRSYEKDHLLP
ncbi:hypothetical protein [Methanomethylophilus alvi]|uniref:hypothetical protein n=1 Tax=Methanomethylophilus alvi TaxID=1291540 RepID=UPI0037DD793C